MSALVVFLLAVPVRGDDHPQTGIFRRMVDYILPSRGSIRDPADEARIPLHSSDATRGDGKTAAKNKQDHLGGSTPGVWQDFPEECQQMGDRTNQTLCAIDHCKMCGRYVEIFREVVCLEDPFCPESKCSCEVEQHKCRCQRVQKLMRQRSDFGRTCENFAEVVKKVLNGTGPPVADVLDKFYEWGINNHAQHAAASEGVVNTVLQNIETLLDKTPVPFDFRQKLLKALEVAPANEKQVANLTEEEWKYLFDDCLLYHDPDSMEIEGGFGFQKKIPYVASYSECSRKEGVGSFLDWKYNGD